MTSDACINCEGWGRECDMCRIGIPEDRPKEVTVKEESIGKLLIETFSENELS